MTTLSQTPPPPDTAQIESLPMGQNGHKRNGMIAQLPKATRDQINQWLDDGHSYPQIIEDLGEQRAGLKPAHFTSWYQGGYQDYLRQQDLRADIRSTREFAAGLPELHDGHEFENTLMQLGLTEIFRALADPKTKTDPLYHIRVFNALARLNREALSLRKYNDLRADQAAALLKTANGAPTADDFRNSFLFGFEKVSGVKPADGPIGPDINHLLEPPPTSSSTSSPTSSVTLSKTSPAAQKSDERGSPKSDPSVPSEIPQIPESNDPPIQSPPESCPQCGAQLPPLKPDGTRPSNACPGCQIKLYPPGTTFDRCPACEKLQPISAAGERYSTQCEHCRQTLPPPGQRFLTECPGCGLKLRNFTQDGSRISDHCPDCRTLLPLLEPSRVAPQPSEGVPARRSAPDESEPVRGSSSDQGGPVRRSASDEGGSQPLSNSPPPSALAA